MKRNSALYIGMTAFAVLAVLCMSAAACWVCGTLDPSLWTKIENKKPGDKITVSVPAQAGMTYSFVQHVKQGLRITSTVLTPSDPNKPNEVLVTVPDACNIEMGIVVTISNPNDATCTRAKCIWFEVPCPTCPTLPSFCEGKATQAQIAAWDVPGYSETWKINGNTFDPATLNTLADGAYNAHMFIGTKDVCNKDFTVYAMPDDFTISATPV